MSACIPRLLICFDEQRCALAFQMVTKLVCSDIILTNQLNLPPYPPTPTLLLLFTSFNTGADLPHKGVQ